MLAVIVNLPKMHIPPWYWFSHSSPATHLADWPKLTVISPAAPGAGGCAAAALLQLQLISRGPRLLHLPTGWPTTILRLTLAAAPLRRRRLGFSKADSTAPLSHHSQNAKKWPDGPPRRGHRRQHTRPKPAIPHGPTPYTVR